MQRLNRGMLRRYEIPEHAPSRVRAVQFGLSEALLGVADRLLDAACPHIGIACVAPDAPWDGEGANPAALLREQEGLFTLLARGYRGETPVKDEIVIQSILCVAEGFPWGCWTPCRSACRPTCRAPPGCWRRGTARAWTACGWCASARTPGARRAPGTPSRRWHRAPGRASPGG